ncbi:hypothetical protein LTR01_004709 [Friedmanniomyces endolithicus]|nr:hypothetical protein LTR01_004709 [Friedmanniomyces endolithicus]KAK0829843.1 hypothetical protein LTR73_003979 [Friedmanniomyces endolithicus]
MAPRVSASSRVIRAEVLDPTVFAPFGDVIQNPATHGDLPRLPRVEANQGSATKWLEVTKMRSWYDLGRSRKRAEVAMNMFVCKPRQLEQKAGSVVFPVKILERHPFTPQTFLPLGVDRAAETCYLVIVAPTLPLRSRKGSDESLNPPYPVPPPRRRRSLRERLLGARPNLFTNDSSSRTTPTEIVSSGSGRKGPGLPDLERIRAFIARGDQAITYGAGTWHAPMVVLGQKAIDFVVVQYMNGVAIEDCQECELEAESGGDGLAVDLDGFVGNVAARAKLSNPKLTSLLAHMRKRPFEHNKDTTPAQETAPFDRPHALSLVKMVERDHHLLRELRDGKPARSNLGNGQWTSDFQISQPLGDWRFDGAEAVIHSGDYILPLHSPDDHGYCYLALFQERYQATAVARLGKLPRSSQLREVCSRHLNFLADEQFQLRISVGAKMMIAHISPRGGDKTATRLLDILPIQKCMVGTGEVAKVRRVGPRKQVVPVG